MNTKNKWLIGIAVGIGLIALFFLPSLWHAIFPTYGYGVIGSSGGYMPMMSGGYGRGGFGYGFMFFGMFFMWLIPLGLIALIGLGIAALIKYLNTKST